MKALRLAWFDIFYSGPYLENLLPEILSVCLQASSTLPVSSWGSLEREREKKQASWGWEVGNMRNFLPILNLTCTFQKGIKMGDMQRKKAPALDTGCPVSQTPARDQPVCPFPSKIVFKIQPSTFKNLSLISNSNKRTAWWLLFCFLLPNSSLRLHNKSV